MDGKRQLKHLPPGAVFRHGDGQLWAIPEPNRYTRAVASAPHVVAVCLTGAPEYHGPLLHVFHGDHHVEPVPGARVTFRSPPSPHPWVHAEELRELSAGGVEPPE